ncbi:MAG: helicase-associated domain-containing protein [Candidatus Poribacteria bacterium]|nr:helicase-associated domain-containing protein [Candidatus Poribacteria bacterium]
MTSCRFDTYLSKMRVESLKSMARIFGGRSQMRKAECIKSISGGLADARQVKAAVERLNPFERTALAQLKEMGGEAEVGALALAIRISGCKLPTSRRYSSDPAISLLEPLIQRGLVMSERGVDYLFFSSHIYSDEPRIVFSDERLLAGVQTVEFPPFAISPTDVPLRTGVRRPAAMLLDIMGMLSAIDELGGLPLTKSGRVRKNPLRKLMRALGWELEGFSIDGLTFPRPGLAFPATLENSGLLTRTDGGLELGVSLDTFAKRTPVEQIRPLTQGFVGNSEWQELETQSWYDAGESYVLGRQVLCLAMRRLPSDTDGFFAIDDLSEMLFLCTGAHFSLERRVFRPAFAWHRSEKEAEKEEQKWMENRRKAWEKLERRFISAALETWLYYLCLVELGWTQGNDAPTHFRLTELGRAVFLPKSDVEIEAKVDESQPGWVIQPNFEMIVYLDTTSPTQLAFLERHAQRVEVQQHTAHYRMTREKVYHALENGSTLEELLSGLKSGSAIEIPQNVETEIRQWAALREEIALHRQARLLFFPSTRSRQKAIDGGFKGTPIGDRFLLLAEQQADDLSRQKKFDYAKALPKCLAVTEKGQITRTDSDLDLLVEPTLDRWAERKSNGGWLLTQASVQAGLDAKHAVDELFDFLGERLTHRIPLLLSIALQAFSGEKFDVNIESVTVLSCPIPKVFLAITRSRTLKPYLKGQLGSNLVVVETGKVQLLRAQLEWLGLQICDELIIPVDAD